MDPAPKAAKSGGSRRKPFGANSVPARRRKVAAVTGANDDRYPDGSAVETGYPLTREQQDGDRSAWPWLPGTVIGQCGPDEWDVAVRQHIGTRVRSSSRGDAMAWPAGRR